MQMESDLIEDDSVLVWNSKNISETMLNIGIMESFRHLFAFVDGNIRNSLQSSDHVIFLQDSSEHRMESSVWRFTFPATGRTFNRAPERALPSTADC